MSIKPIVTLPPEVEKRIKDGRPFDLSPLKGVYQASIYSDCGWIDGSSTESPSDAIAELELKLREQTTLNAH